MILRITRLSVRHPRVVLALAFVAVAVSLGIAATRLTLRTSNLDLIDPAAEPVRRFREFASEFGTPNVLVVCLEGDDEPALRAAVDRLGPRLLAGPGVRSVIDRLPFEDAVLESIGVEPYITSHDHRMFYVFVQPSDPDSSVATLDPFVRGVRAALADSDLGALGVRAGLTGMPAYALDDRDVIRQDISRLSALSLLAVSALVVGVFGSLGRPVLMVSTLLAGSAVTLGLTSLYPGHLTLLSAFFATILFGMGMDSATHIVHRLEELERAGLHGADAILRAMTSVGRGLFSSALTAAAAFLSMLFAGFRGFAELGLIAGGGLLICLLAMISVLPALLVLVPVKRRARPPAFASALDRLLVRMQGRLPAAALCAVALGCFLVGPPTFDRDYLNLEPVGSEAARLEREMVERSDLSPHFAVFVVANREGVQELSDRLLDDPTVGDVHSILELELLADALGANVDEFPASFLSGVRSARGRHAIYAYPAGDIWDAEEGGEFLAHMRAIDPGVTGIPFLGDFMIERSERALWITMALGAALALISVLGDFRSLKLASLAALPTVMTIGSLAGAMHLFGIRLNPLNLMALPVVIGIAIDEGIHIVHRWIEERGDIARMLAGTGVSITLTSWTTIVAFGTLAFSVHRGLASFAIVLTIGVGLAWLCSAIVLPAALPVVLRSARGSAHLNAPALERR